MEIEAILRLLGEGRSQKQAAEELGISYGKLKYWLAKYRSISGALTSEVSAAKEENAPSALCSCDEETWEEAEGPDRITAMPVDHETLYVYWEITGARKRWAEEHFHCSWHALPQILRVYDVTLLEFDGDHANRHFDFHVHQEADNWFLRGLPPGCSYIVDYGTTTPDGRYITLLRSNTVQTPPNQESFESHCRKIRIGLQAPPAEPGWRGSFTGYSLRTGQPD